MTAPLNALNRSDLNWCARMWLVVTLAAATEIDMLHRPHQEVAEVLPLTTLLDLTLINWFSLGQIAPQAEGFKQADATKDSEAPFATLRAL